MSVFPKMIGRRVKYLWTDASPTKTSKNFLNSSDGHVPTFR